MRSKCVSEYVRAFLLHRCHLRKVLFNCHVQQSIIYFFAKENSLLIQFRWLKFHRWCTHEHQIKAEIDTFAALKNCKLATELLINLVKITFYCYLRFLLFLHFFYGEYNIIMCFLWCLLYNLNLEATLNALCFIHTSIIPQRLLWLEPFWRMRRFIGQRKSPSSRFHQLEVT